MVTKAAASGLSGLVTLVCVAAAWALLGCPKLPNEVGIDEVATAFGIVVAAIVFAVLTFNDKR